ncbi:pre-toxin TG domain-containing protein [Streptococcus oralis]|uniref:pre-toxin TG domain-containing protein n=1 Tax=Streptococcus oralis TaxID=1303 RepID=UPI000A60C28E|nr:pre-toxin TG domain-containing protein [Streptococcus oralis]
MTKDVELHSSTWKTMKQAITGLTENATVSSSGYGNYTNAQAGSYSTGTASTGFAKRVEDLVKISEKVQKLIKEKDTDGVVSYTYHDETSTAQTLQAKLSTLERYAENVNTYINKKIDRPFYEAMDKVGAKLEALNIQKYKTTNKIGYKRIESVKDVYGHPVGTKEVTPPEIGIDELYKVDSPYKASLKKSYEKYKKSKDYKDHRLTETEYVQVMHQTRSFEYVSIDDEKSTIEMWRDLTLSAATVVLLVFCPPAGAVLSTVVAAADMYSAASGKDWGTGRELDGNERVIRGAFALLDLIPAGKYLSGLAKTGKTVGLTAVKTSIKTAVKEGVEQGAKNFDTFKGLLKKTKGLGDNIFSQIKTFGKQLDNLRPSKILSNSADDLSDAAQRFSLNSLEQLQPVTGSIPFEGGKLTHQADNLSAFAKNLDGSVDDVVEANRFSSEWHNLQKSFPDSGLSERQSEKIVNIKPSETIKRPDPEEYLSSNYIKEHNALFDEGVAAFAKNDYWIQKEGYFGRPDGAFVFPKDVAEAMVKEADGDPRVLEKLLGLDKGSLGNNPIMIEPKEVENLRIPSGNEGGASGNVQWRPGGKTYPGGVPESVIDRVPKDKLNIKELWSEQ